MHPKEVRRHLDQQPFLPFRIYVSDGSTYDVREPSFAYVSQREIVVGLEAYDSGVPKRSAYLDPVHVTRIEPLVNGARRKRKR